MSIRRTLLVSAAGIPLAAAAACSQCGSPSAEPDAGAPDAADVRIDGKFDSGAETSSWDGGVINDWPGWRRETELDPSCPTDVPIDPATAMPKLVWVPCTSGRANCEELDLNQIPHPTVGGTFTQARPGPGGAFVVFQHLTDEKDVAEWDVYNRTTLEPLAAWRFVEGVAPGCLAGPIPTHDRLVAYATFYGTSNVIPATAIGTPAELMANATFVHWAPDPQARAQYASASDTTFAGDLGLAGAVLRLPPATAIYVKTAPSGLSQPLVHDDDVFAWSNHGNNLWSEELVVKPDASTYVLRAATGRNVVGFATDGTTLWWQETSGTTDPDKNYGLTVDVFRAPYTTDPATLASTAKKLATFTNATPNTSAITFNGIYAWSGPNALTTYIVRGDGATTQVPSDGKTYSQIAAYVSSSEYWSIESKLPNGPTGVAFTKIQLGSW